MFDFFDQPVSAVPDSPTASIDSSVLQSFDSGKTFVISVSGHSLYHNSPQNAFISKFNNSVNNLVNKGYKLVLVAGGGTLATELQGSSKSMGADAFQRDLMGIKATQMNALLLIHGIEKAYHEPCKSISQAKEIIQKNQVPVFGGLFPSLTSDSVSALLAEFLHCPFINMTNVDGVFDINPSKFKQAKLIEKMNHLQLIKLVARDSFNLSGSSIITDLSTALILNRSKIQSFVLNFNDLNNFENCVEGLQFKGTIINDKNEPMQVNKDTIQVEKEIQNYSEV